MSAVNNEPSTRPSQTAPAQTRQGFADLVIAAIITAVAIYVLISASGMRRLSTGDIGAGLFPTVIGTLLLACAAGLLAQHLIRSRRAAAGDATSDTLATSSATDVASEPADSGTGDDAAAQPAAAEDDDADDRTPGWRLGLNAGVVLAGIVGYVLVAEYVGFVPTMFVILLGIQLSLRAGAVRSIAVAALLTAIMYALFQWALMVQLPAGPLGI